MDGSLKRVPPKVLRSRIAARYLGATSIARTLGTIELRDHQVDAVCRLGALLKESGGALLADEVGLGKTYTALAVAADAARPLIIAPASLLPMWRASADRAGVTHASFVSHESLSRRRFAHSDRDLLVVDEAHHARNPATNRYRELARLASGRRTLLLSATPVHNSERDLRSLFALFWGSRAWTCALHELSRFVVRREQRSLGAMTVPVALAPVWLDLPCQDDLLEQIVALPPPVPASDGGDGGALVVHGLVRQWASSEGALVRALIRRKARALSLIAALEEGRYPTSAELRAWTHSEDALQLAFPALLPPARGETASLLASVRAHEHALAVLLTRLRGSQDADVHRAQHITGLRHRHAGSRIVAFTQYADTAHALYAALAPRGGVAVLTSRGALTVGGKLTRADALDRFNSPRMSVAERIDVLIATDLLSEGIDLPEVAVVVHLDLPWTPARLEQRVGRAVRLTSRRREVHVYCMSPPASAAALLRVEAVLRRKMGDAARTVGMAGAILPAIQLEAPASAPPSQAEESIRSVLSGWRTFDGAAGALDEPYWAAVHGRVGGWVALIEEDERPLLIACTGNDITDDALAIAPLLRECSDAEAPVASEHLERVRQEIGGWIRCRGGASSAGLSIAPGARSGARLLKRIGAVANRAPFHRRGAIASLASQARRAVLARRGIGAERVLAELADSPLPDDAWLRAIGAFADVNARSDACPDRGCRVLALLLIVPV